MRSNAIDPRDEQWVRERLGQKFDDDGVCFATFNDELLGPFSCKANAEAAQNRKLAELEAQGVDLAAASPRMAVIFGDPSVYQMPTGGING